MIPCLLLKRKIPKVRCDVRRIQPHKGSQKLPLACKECLKEKKEPSFESRIDQLIKGYGQLRRTLWEIAIQHGRNLALLEDHKYQVGVLQRRMRRPTGKGANHHGSGKKRQGPKKAREEKTA